MEKITLKIKGMHCASCAVRIEKALNTLEGVKAKVNFPLEKAFIEYDPEKVDIEKIKKVIRDNGYDFFEEKEEAKGLSKVNLKVSGMASPHCAGIVERAVKKLEGVKEVKTEFEWKEQL